MKMKKTVLLAIVAMISMGSALGAGCSACAANAAIKEAYQKSKQDAQAAALAAKPKEAKLNQAKQNAKADKRAAELDAVVAERAPRESQVDPCNPCGSNVEDFNGDLNCKLQALFNCCVHANQQLRCQGREAKKCCKKLHHEIDEVEDLVVVNSSIIEGLIISDISLSAACCSVLDSNLSVIEGLIVSQIDQAALCCSLTETLLLSQIDASAACCSIMETQILDVNASVAAVLAVVLSIFDCTCT